MTTDTDIRRPLPSRPDAAAARTAWLQEVADHLPPSCFPGSHDDLVAALLRHHAPSHLLWHLSVLPRTRRFESAQELLDELAHADGSSPTVVSVPT